jgi:hypothetical protein
LVCCPNCGSRLNARSEFWKWHDISCPTCSSQLEVEKRSKIILWKFMAVSGFVCVFLPMLYYGGNIIVLVPLLTLWFIVCSVYWNTVYYSKYLKFKLKASNASGSPQPMDIKQHNFVDIAMRFWLGPTVIASCFRRRSRIKSHYARGCLLCICISAQI